MTPHVSAHSPAFRPSIAIHFDRINQVLQLSPEELDLLASNGFVVSERLPFEQFKRAYGYIYRNDLPVLVTTDSILHAIHQTYDKLLMQLEMTVLTLKLKNILAGTRDYLRGAAETNQDERLTSIYEDLDLYLSVPLALLESFPFRRHSPEPGDDPIEQYVVPIRNINSSGRMISLDKDGKLVEVERKRVGAKKVCFFGLEREIDFTLFQARGHYTEPHELCAYFTAMMWLGLIDFQLVGYSPTGAPQVQIGQLVAAYLLRDALTATQQRQNWESVDHVLNAFVGWSDNVTLNGLDQFIENAGISGPADYFAADPHYLLQMLTTNDYGKQHIRSHGQMRASNLDDTLPHTVSFTLMGQRFTIESYVMGELIFDKLKVNGQLVERAYPMPLDVMAALGNRRALEHLSSEFARYGYRDRLLELRGELSTTSHEFWQSSFYNLWLNAIRALNVETNRESYPSTMRTSTWADKMLHCQLAGWTQLRHDNILYVKPPFEPAVGCEFPAGYVEPYPEFFAAVAEYARFGREVFAELPVEYAEAPATSENNGGPWGDVPPLPVQAYQTWEQAVSYFAHLESTAVTLGQLARKELQGEPFTEADTLFLRSVVVRKYVGDTSYGGRTEEEWDGWYVNLLPFGDESPVLVTDVYTHTNKKIGEPGVLHIGLGDPVAMLFLAETSQGQAMFMGPTFTYYEHLEKGLPPNRLTDQDWYWQYKYGKGKAVEFVPPEWTQSFRLTSTTPRQLQMPGAWEMLGIDKDLQKKIYDAYDAVASEGVDVMAYKRHGIRGFCAMVQGNPTVLLHTEGFDERKAADLIDRMTHAGFFEDN